MKRIRIHILALALLFSSMSIVPVFANKSTLGPATVSQGYTMFWWPSNNSYGYTINKGTIVKISFDLGSSENYVYYGLENGYNSNEKTQFAQFSGSASSSASKSVDEGGVYKPYITNYTASTIDIKGTSYIEY